MLDYPTFKKLVGELTEIDLNNYKSPQMDRRINTLKQNWGYDNYDDFLKGIKDDPQKYKEFVKKLTINVSEFFRNPERFMELQNHIIPDLLAKTSQMKIWSAGCSDGAEPYSVAIILRELNAENHAKIIATDVDKQILERAQNAVYGFHEVKSLPKDLIDRYFEVHDGLYTLHDDIKKMVEFRAHNLHTDPYETNLDLIICRNVVIYFTAEAKAILYNKFYNSLRSGGYLMVGGTEPLLNYRQFGFLNPIPSFYCKP